MKKPVYVLLWLVGVVVFLLLTAHFTLRHSLNTPKFKAAATGYIERHTGRAADYERIDYTLFPFSLVIRHASLKEPETARDFASMKEFSVYVDWRAKEITSLKLAEPTIRIVQWPDGTYNFSDLLPAPPAKPDPDAPAEPAPAARPAPAPRKKPAEPAAPPLSIRLVEIENANFEFVSVAEDGQESTFTLTHLDLTLKDWAPGLPIRIDGSANIGKTSSFRFELSGPALSDHAGDLLAWPLTFTSRLEIRDFADWQVFLPADTLPFQQLWATLAIQGAVAQQLDVAMEIGTPEATESHPVSLQAQIRASLSLPDPVARHLFTGADLPGEWAVALPPCEPPPGAMALTDDITTALLLRHLQGTFEMDVPAMAYGDNRLTNGKATAYLRSGILTMPQASLSAYGGTLEARGHVQLLDCPLFYRLDRLAVQGIAIDQALAANGLADYAHVSGRLNLETHLAGHAVGEEGLRSLEADAVLRIDDLQSVGTGGSLVDQAWLQLDNPILLRLVPRLKSKVEQAKTAAENVTTSRYEEATATLALRDGTVTLTDARLAMPDYRLHLAGTILPLDDRLDLEARLVASPEETNRLTDGRVRSAYLPYEEGGLMIPLTLRGALQKPLVLPNLDLLLQNALSGGGIPEEIAPHLERLSESDQRRIQEGIQILRGLGRSK